MLFIQLYTIVFAASLAWLNRIPCVKMINYGASIREEKEWHKVNFVVKLLWAIVWPAILFMQHHPVLVWVKLFALIGLIQWCVFDVVLSKLLHGSFFYLGKTAAIDRRFRTFFGVQEGLWKFVICGIAIILINLFL